MTCTNGPEIYNDNIVDTHKSWRLAALALALALLVVLNLAVWLLAETTREGPETTANQAQAQLDPPTATVELKNLVETMVLRCRFDAADVIRHTLSEARPLLGTPVVTSVHASTGDTLVAGDVPLTVSGRPVIVLPGSFPAFRDLRTGDVGPDIQQLQEALADLQFGAGGEQGVHGLLDERTAQLVDDLYGDLGYQPARNTGDDPDLVLPAAEVAIVSDLPSTVVASPPEVGSVLAPDTLMFVVSSSRLVLDCPLTASQDLLVNEGLTAVIDTPEGPRLTGTTERPTIGEGDYAPGSTIEAMSRVRVLLAQDAPASLLGSTARATVRLRGSEDQVLSVPSTALAAHSDGTASVTVLDESGTSVPVPVTVGVSVGGWVAVEGEGIDPGDTVLLGDYPGLVVDDAGAVDE